MNTYELFVLVVEVVAVVDVVVVVGSRIRDA
jgi:hypothetical protein